MSPIPTCTVVEPARGQRNMKTDIFRAATASIDGAHRHVPLGTVAVVLKVVVVTDVAASVNSMDQCCARFSHTRYYWYHLGTCAIQKV